jgi:hypothetical protein
MKTCNIIVFSGLWNCMTQLNSLGTHISIFTINIGLFEKLDIDDTI